MILKVKGESTLQKQHKRMVSFNVKTIKKKEHTLPLLSLQVITTTTSNYCKITRLFYYSFLFKIGIF